MRHDKSSAGSAVACEVSVLGHHLATAWPLLISAIGVCMDMHSLHKMHCVDSHSLSVLLLLTLPRWEGLADGQMVSCMQVRQFFQ